MNDPASLSYFSAGLSGLLLVVVIWQTYRLTRLERLRKEFFATGLDKNFEQILIDQNRSLTKINQELKNHDKNLAQIFKDNKNNFQKIGFVRYNPFDDAGGNISFVLAMLNAHDDGVVISSLHGREGTRVYSKVIKAGKSESQLTEEEIKAIKNAK